MTIASVERKDEIIPGVKEKEKPAWFDKQEQRNAQCSRTTPGLTRAEGVHLEDHDLWISPGIHGSSEMS